MEHIYQTYRHVLAFVQPIAAGLCLNLLLTVVTLMLLNQGALYPTYASARWFQAEEILATFVFAIVGAQSATTGVSFPYRHSTMVTFAASFLTANGGGTLRDLLKGEMPFWIEQPIYMLVPVAATVLVSTVRFQAPQKSARVLAVLDDFATAIFVCLGVDIVSSGSVGHFPNTAHEFFIHTATTVGVMTGVGGGILRDYIVLREFPGVFASWNIAPVLLSAIAYSTLQSLEVEHWIAPIPMWLPVCILMVIASRWIAVIRG